MNWRVRSTKNVCNFIEHLISLAFIVSGCISISDFDSSVGIPAGNASFAVGLKNYAITAGIKKYKSWLKRRKKCHKLVMLAKTKLKQTEVLISKALIDSNVIHSNFFLPNNVQK